MSIITAIKNWLTHEVKQDIAAVRTDSQAFKDALIEDLGKRIAVALKEEIPELESRLGDKLEVRLSSYLNKCLTEISDRTVAAPTGSTTTPSVYSNPTEQNKPV